MIGHFTAMAQEKTVAIGCALLKYRAFNPKDGLMYFQVYLVCNYSYTNMLGEAVYTAVANPRDAGIGCKRYTSTRYGGLCNTSEDILSVPNKPDLSTYTKNVQTIVTYVTDDGREFQNEWDIRRLGVSYHIITRTYTTYIPPTY